MDNTDRGNKPDQAELLLISAPERVPGRSSHWSMLNMPSGTPAISIWRQIERHCGSSW